MEELDHIDKMLAMAVQTLHVHSVLLTHVKQWLKEAEQCKAEGVPCMCEAIVSTTIVIDVEEEDCFVNFGL